MDGQQIDSHAREIMERFIAGCPRPELTGAWRFLKADADCRLLRNVDPLIDQLRSHAKEERLLASGLLVLDSQRRAVPNPRLATNDGFAVAIRDRQGKLSDLLTSAGTLSGRLPLFAPSGRSRSSAVCSQRSR
jgi:hypothetical protein